MLAEYTGLSNFRFPRRSSKKKLRKKKAFSPVTENTPLGVLTQVDC
jgi:hypothetical protein